MERKVWGNINIMRGVPFTSERLGHFMATDLFSCPSTNTFSSPFCHGLLAPWNTTPTLCQTRGVSGQSLRHRVVNSLFVAMATTRTREFVKKVSNPFPDSEYKLKRILLLLRGREGKVGVIRVDLLTGVE
jgi:hypothetical protein